MVIHRTGWINAGYDPLAQLRLFPVSGKTGIRKDSGDPLRVLRIGSSREVVIRHIKHDGRKILEFPDLECGICRITAGVLLF